MPSSRSLTAEGRQACQVDDLLPCMQVTGCRTPVTACFGGCEGNRLFMASSHSIYSLFATRGATFTV